MTSQERSRDILETSTKSELDTFIIFCKRSLIHIWIKNDLSHNYFLELILL